MRNRVPRSCRVSELAQMYRHLALLADLHEEELAHADVVGLCYGATRVEIDSIGS